MFDERGYGNQLYLQSAGKSGTATGRTSIEKIAMPASLDTDLRTIHAPKEDRILSLFGKARPIGQSHL